jgi:ABC-type branched-subunit amino acid transport system substrate-binding protein
MLGLRFSALREKASRATIATAQSAFGASRRWIVAGLASAVLAGCGTAGRDLPVATPEQQQAFPPPAPQAPQSPGAQIGTGTVKVGLILSLSAQGNAGLVSAQMKNAAEMALLEFNNPNIQLLVKDDGGVPQGAQQAAQQAVSEGAELIIGPIFAQAVTAVGQVARQRGIPVIGFSTDASAATRGVYLLSFLPETDINRIVDYSVSQGKRSFAALIPDNAYGGVAEAAFQQAVARRGGRVVAIERYPTDLARMQEAARRVAQAAQRADAIFIPDGADGTPQVVNALVTSGLNLRRVQLLGTGQWEDQRIFANAAMNGALFAAPAGDGFKNFASRYQQRYGQEPIRPAALAYDAVALVAALVKTQGAQRFSEQVLTNPSGFAGIDGVFRFKPDGTNERGLAVLRVTPSGTQVAAPPQRTFSGN